MGKLLKRLGGANIAQGLGTATACTGVGLLWGVAVALIVLGVAAIAFGIAAEVG